MYKVFIKDSSLSFTNSPTNCSDNWLRLGSEKMIQSLIADLENLKEKQDICLVCADTELGWQQFQDNYKIIEAAGGAVRNDKGELLMIHRLGMWDLPKGKIEEGEAIDEAAIREVEEECGISNLRIKRQLIDTYHTYELKGQRILKRTYWFEMVTDFDGSFTPQIEEDIHEVKWLEEKNLPDYLSKTYTSIQYLLENYLNS